MPRPRSHTKASLARAAMDIFWKQGYAATSLDDVVKQTGVSRHGIYSDYKGKQVLFLACLDTYTADIVTPAFARVEAVGASLADIQAYFDHQIDLADMMGLPGPGCLIANTQTEVAPHNMTIRDAVTAHNDRLRRGFGHALLNEAPHLPVDDLDRWADILTVFAQGLWSMSRVSADASELRAAIKSLLTVISEKVLS